MKKLAKYNILWIVLYWITRGFTEGWKWADKIPSAGAYHIVRLIECIAVYAIAVSAFGWRYPTAMFLIGMFIYERINMYVDKKVWFKEKGSKFDIGIKIGRYPWQDWGLLTAGVLIWLYE